MGQGAFEHRNGVLEIPLMEDKVAEPVLGKDRATQMASRLGNAGGFFATSEPFSKLP